MTNTTKLTNIAALTAVLNGEPITGELAKKLQKMLASEEKKAAKAKESRANGSESKEKIQNRNIAMECVRAIVEAGNEPRNSVWLMEHVKGLMTAQAVSGKMNIARVNGWVTYSGEMIDKRRAWFATDKGIELVNNMQ